MDLNILFLRISCVMMMYQGSHSLALSSSLSSTLPRTLNPIDDDLEAEGS